MRWLLTLTLAATIVAADEAMSSSKTASRGESGSRPTRGGGVFDDPDDEAEAPIGADPAASAAHAANDATTDAIVADMRAHLKRRQKRAQADLIGDDRGLIARAVGGVGDFFKSRYFANVRKSLGVFLGMWLWYVLNTQTYIRPDDDD